MQSANSTQTCVAGEGLDESGSGLVVSGREGREGHGCKHNTGRLKKKGGGGRGGEKTKGVAIKDAHMQACVVR